MFFFKTNNESTANKKIRRDTLDLIPYKRFVDDDIIELKGDRSYLSGYINLFEITGKSINTMAIQELQNTLSDYGDWIVYYGNDFSIQTTNLPINVDSQIEYLKNNISHVSKLIKVEQGKVNVNKRKVEQLNTRYTLLQRALEKQELIRDQVYNTEYILYIYSDDLNDMKRKTIRAMQGSTPSFNLKVCSKQKKAQILERFYNMNSKL